ncbi:MAG: helix-turn-helix domain-containing protein [Patescibacteria group bacterium]|jgi:cytoskeletal protein RodZ
MISFSKKPLTEESLASKLYLAREAGGIKLADAAIKLNIKPEYLEALEKGRYDLLPGGIYEKIFLKKYSSFLGLEFVAVEKEYAEERLWVSSNKDVFTKKKIEKKNFLAMPKILKNIFLAIGFLVLLSYLIFCLKTSLSAPKIKIFFPPNNLVTVEKSLEISGSASEKTQVSINGKQILKDDSGTFKEVVELKIGLNAITISARNKYGREQIIKKQILVK